MQWLKASIMMGVLFSPILLPAYDPMAGVRGDVSKILDPKTSDKELEEIGNKHRKWINKNQGGVTSQEMRNRANESQIKQQNRKSAFQYQKDANYWSAQEKAARAAGDPWSAEKARQNAEYYRQKAKEYGH